MKNTMKKIVMFKKLKRYFVISLVLIESILGVSYSSDLKEEPEMFIIFGYPGAGKGTFGQTLIPRGYNHLSIGDMMREELKKGSKIGLEYQKEIESGKFLPSDVIQQVVEERILEDLKEKKRLILDGYPRTLEQAQTLDLFIKQKHKDLSFNYVYIEVDPEIALKRILNRRTCSQCNQIYNLEYSPPKKEGFCDTCSQPLVKRTSDNLEDAGKRIEAFNMHLKDLLSFYKDNPYLLILNGNKPYQECIEDYQNILK